MGVADRLVREVTGSKPGSRAGWSWTHFGLFSPYFGINGAGTIPGEGIFDRNGYDGFSSYHPGGCHFLLVDGSTQFFSENTDSAVLLGLCTRGEGEVVSPP